MNREPTKEQLAAMAYADGELDDAARAEFEQLMATRPDLAREVAQLQRLELLSRQVAGPEPKDTEWERLSHDHVQRAGGNVGLGLLALGSLGLIVWCVLATLAGGLSPLGKASLLGLLAGSLLLLFSAVRARLRTRPFDPYTEVKR